MRRILNYLREVAWWRTSALVLAVAGLGIVVGGAVVGIPYLLAVGGAVLLVAVVVAIVSS